MVNFCFKIELTFENHHCDNYHILLYNLNIKEESKKSNVLIFKNYSITFYCRYKKKKKTIVILLTFK